MATTPLLQPPSWGASGLPLDGAKGDGWGSVSTVPAVVDGGASLADRRDAIQGAAEALRGLGEVIHQAGGTDLLALLGEVDELVMLAGAARFVTTAEAISRGEVARSDAASLTAWVTEHAPSTRQGGAGPIAKAAHALSLTTNALLREAVEAGRVTVAVAGTILAEIGRIESRLVDGARDTVLGAMITMGEQHGSAGVRRVRPELLARHGQPEELDREQERLRRGRALSRPVVEDGLHEYRVVLDPEGAAVLEAALEALSAPAPTEDPDSRTREPDLRTSDQRRADALVELVRGAVAGMDTRAGRGAKATLLVTMSYDDLTARTYAARTLGGLDTGTLIAPETIRRLACDAQIIPMVLGSDGEVLDHGRAVRLFTPAQVRHLWVRDDGCTYPGCTTPARWSDAHHLLHWADGGPTTLDNAALLCGRHHTIVHSRRLHGEVVTAPTGTGPPRVEWDLTLGSYDRQLTAWPRAG